MTTHDFQYKISHTPHVQSTSSKHVFFDGPKGVPESETHFHLTYISFPPNTLAVYDAMFGVFKS